MCGLHALVHQNGWPADCALTRVFDGQVRQSEGTPWLTLSSLGTGTYLGDDNKATDQSVAAGIVMAVHNGWNVIDTASNYRNGRAEVGCSTALQTELHACIRQHGLLSVLCWCSSPRSLQHRFLPQSHGAQFYVGPTCTCLAPVQRLQVHQSTPLVIGDLIAVSVQASVGQAIQVLRGIHSITGIPGMTGREMVFITTKACFLSQQQWLPLIQQGKIKEGDVIRGQHCIHPECPESRSLERSLQAMNIETVRLVCEWHNVRARVVAQGLNRWWHRYSVRDLHPGQALA